MRLNDWAAPEHSDSASGMLDFVLVAFAFAAVSEVVLAQRPATSYRLAEVVYEMAALVAVSPLSIAPAA